MKQNSPKYYKVYTAADGRVCVASVEFAADFGANAPENCPCMGYIKVMHGNKRVDAPCYLMPAKMAKLLKPEEYRPAPTGGSSPAAPKSRPDAATMALYWLLTEAAAFADAEPQRVFDNGQYKLIAKEAPDMLKRLKREFNITKNDLKTYPLTVAPAPIHDQQQPEPAAAPVEDIEAAVVAHFEDLAANAPADDPAADILRAGIETGKVIICSVPKAEPTTPAEQKTALTDAEVMETAARIRANYEAMQADIEAEREQAAAAFAEAITAYCEELEQSEPLAWEPETIIIPFEPRPAAEVEQPRRRHRLNLRPRLSRWLHPARWVAAAFVVCLLSGLLLGMNTSTAAADDIAAVYELHPVTVTAEAPDTFIEDKAPCLIEYKAPCLIEDKAPCLIEDKAPAPSPVKKLAAPSPVKNVADAAECSSQKTDTADTPAGEKTASPMNTASDPHGLTICEGTPWAYTMMNWA